MLRITVVVGNPKPRSRTGKIAEALARQLMPAGETDFEIIDLADYADELFAWPSQKMADLNGRVAESHLVVICSPTYKASFTGLLKAFLDRYPANGLHGVVAIPLMTGADLGHSMAPTVNLVPLLHELGAVVPTRGLYFNTAQMDQVDEFIATQVAAIRDTLGRLSAVARATGASSSEGRGAN